MSAHDRPSQPNAETPYFPWERCPVTAMALEIHALVLDIVEGLPEGDVELSERLVASSSDTHTQLGLAAGEYDPFTYYELLQRALSAANRLAPALAACVLRALGPPGAAFRGYSTLRALRTELSARLYD